MYFYFNSDSKEYDTCIIKIEETNLLLKCIILRILILKLNLVFYNNIRTKYLNKQFFSLISDSDFKEYDD
jgi:hypothetical protein